MQIKVYRIEIIKGSEIPAKHIGYTLEGIVSDITAGSGRTPQHWVQAVTALPRGIDKPR
jgi:hypothetical protein